MASTFELVQPLAEPTTDRAVMRAYRVNPLNIFPARAYEEDRIVRPFFGRPSILTSRAEDFDTSSSTMPTTTDAPARRRSDFPAVAWRWPVHGFGRHLAGATPRHCSRIGAK